MVNIASAKQHKMRIIVSTDSSEYAEIANQYGQKQLQDLMKYREIYLLTMNVLSTVLIGYIIMKIIILILYFI